jgi:hypothetical protein
MVEMCFGHFLFVFALWAGYFLFCGLWISLPPWFAGRQSGMLPLAGR